MRGWFWFAVSSAPHLRGRGAGPVHPPPRRRQRRPQRGDSSPPRHHPPASPSWFPPPSISSHTTREAALEMRSSTNCSVVFTYLSWSTFLKRRYGTIDYLAIGDTPKMPSSRVEKRTGGQKITPSRVARVSRGNKPSLETQKCGGFFFFVVVVFFVNQPLASSEGGK